MINIDGIRVEQTFADADSYVIVRPPKTQAGNSFIVSLIGQCVPGDKLTFTPPEGRRFVAASSSLWQIDFCTDAPRSPDLVVVWREPVNATLADDITLTLNGS